VPITEDPLTVILVKPSAPPPEPPLPFEVAAKPNELPPPPPLATAIVESHVELVPTPPGDALELEKPAVPPPPIVTALEPVIVIKLDWINAPAPPAPPTRDPPPPPPPTTKTSQFRIDPLITAKVPLLVKV
jgi:hypothetical protein